MEKRVDASSVRDATIAELALDPLEGIGHAADGCKRNVTTI